MTRTIVAFGAHPDDIEIGCGGALLQALANGHKAINVVMTSGEAGSDRIPPGQLAPLREKEAGQAAALLGIGDVHFLGFPDGLTGYTRDMRLQVMTLIRELRPDLIFIHASGEDPGDHRICHELVVSAARSAAGPWFQETGHPPHGVSCILGYEVWQPLKIPGLIVGIDQVIDRKTAAIRAHQSQCKDTRYDEAARGLARYRGIMSLGADHAEAFEIIQLQDIHPAAIFEPGKKA